MGKTTVLILFGGASNEYEVSLRSATAIIQNLDLDRFEPVLMGITKNGRWRLFKGEVSQIIGGDWAKNSVPAILSPDRETHGITIFGERETTFKKIDVVFPALHGQNCEDGVLQGLLELSGIPYVGCGVTSSAITFDKVYTHIICEQAAIPMAKWQLVCAEENFAEAERRIAEKLGYPCFVKPANSGSSVGCSRANNAAELEPALKIAFKEDRRVIVEELVHAHEVECAVIGNLETRAPTTGEILSPDGFYDYDTKYKNDRATLLIPAGVSAECSEKVREIAQRVYKVLDCRGLSRVDFFVQEDNSVIFNEINTLPGFTSISMYPKMMTASGLSYRKLLTELIELAIEEKKRCRT